MMKKNANSEATASVWYIICNFLQKGISVITIPIFTRLMSTDEYGLLSIYQSWSMIISIFATYNLSAGVFNKGLVTYERNSFSSSMLGLSLVITSIFGGICLCFRKLWISNIGLPFQLIIIMFLEFYFIAPIQLWSARQRFELKYKSMVAVTLLITMISTILSVIAVVVCSDKPFAKITSVFTVNAVFGSVLAICIFLKGKKICVIKYWSYAIRFNTPLIPHYLSMIVLQQSDRLFIASMTGEDKAAIYSIAYSISTIITFITNAVTNAFTPYFYKKLKSREYRDIGNMGMILLTLVAVLNVCVILFAPEVVTVFAPIEYYEAIWLVPAVATSVYFMFFYNLFTIVEFYYEKTNWVMYASFIGAVLNLVLNYIFIRLYGYIAAGYTTLFCYIVFAILHYAFSNRVMKEHGIKNIYNTKKLVLLSLAVIIVMVLLIPLYKHSILRYTCIIFVMITLFLKKDKLFNVIKNIRQK